MMLTLGMLLIWLIFTVAVLANQWGKHVWTAGSIIWLLALAFIAKTSTFTGMLFWGGIVITIAVLYVEPLRMLIADRLFQHARKSVPKLSSTEEEALNAGDTWLEQDIFTATPDWERLRKVRTTLTEEEQAFLDNETNTLSAMVDEWSVRQSHDLPEDVWQYMKEKRFFGMVIPKEYGGLGFSARAHSEVVMKLATRSGAAAVTVMVPNSLGPGELLCYYGTEEQKQRWLPRLASGEEIPCFALTEPTAGSDATSIQSKAIVIAREVNGERVLGLSVTLEKRWITLAPVATLIGLAVQLHDPDKLLDGVGCEGITCLLIPRDTRGLEIGNRHLPADQPFMNGTLRGKDLWVPIDSIIGGQKNAGQGWKMLVECLSIGRSISLPALGAGTSTVSYLATSAFARIRRQFGVEIGQFEGVAEKLSEIGGLNYLINATRLLTVAAVNEHKKPSVASAIAKYFNTELARIVINNAMDIHGGRAVVVGPRNYTTGLYQSIPISITVEGANIMSRNLLIFGQGSMACHPYIRDEFYAIARDDKAAFRKAIWGHISYFMTNFGKTVASAFTGGGFIKVPAGPFSSAYSTLTRLSEAFAWIADLALIVLGGDLKRRERLSARLADAMSYLYMAMAVIRVAEEHNADAEEALHAQWALQYCFHHAEKAMLAFCREFPVRPLGLFARFIAFPYGQRMRVPGDRLEAKLAKAMMGNNSYRNRLTKDAYLSGNPEQPLDRMEHALQQIIRNTGLYERVPELRRVGAWEVKAFLNAKVADGKLSSAEAKTLLEVEKARWDAILVDEFTSAAMKKMHFQSCVGKYPSPFDENA